MQCIYIYRCSTLHCTPHEYSFSSANVSIRVCEEGRSGWNFNCCCDLDMASLSPLIGNILIKYPVHVPELRVLPLLAHTVQVYKQCPHTDTPLSYHVKAIIYSQLEHSQLWLDKSPLLTMEKYLRP